MTCFGKPAENAAKYLKKGRRRSWSKGGSTGASTRKDGEKRQGVQIIASRIMYLPSKASIEAQAAASAQTAMSPGGDRRSPEMPAGTPEPVGAGVGGEEDIPF